MAVDLYVGCPVRARAWIIELWFEHVIAAASVAGFDEVGFVFVCDEHDPTVPEIERICAPLDGGLHFVFESEEVIEDRRMWGSDRYHRMVVLRNLLLGKVREIDPGLFLSLDSDILLHPKSIARMVDALDRFDAVGSKTYLGAPPEYPNYGTLLWENHGLRRPDFVGLAKVDVIMAIKLMTPAAYGVDYRWHHNGEDVGWSIACREVGVTLGWDGFVVSNHVRSPEHLNV